MKDENSIRGEHLADALDAVMDVVTGAENFFALAGRAEKGECELNASTWRKSDSERIVWPGLDPRELDGDWVADKLWSWEVRALTPNIMGIAELAADDGFCAYAARVWLEEFLASGIVRPRDARIKSFIERHADKDDDEPHVNGLPAGRLAAAVAEALAIDNVLDTLSADTGHANYLHCGALIEKTDGHVAISAYMRDDDCVSDSEVVIPIAEISPESLRDASAVRSLAEGVLRKETGQKMS